MEKIFSIIGSLKTLFFVLFFFTTFSQSQDWIKDYEYIPIVSPSLWWGWIRDYPEAVTDMKNAGVDVIRWHIEDYTKLDSLLGFGFKVIPLRTLGLNYIEYYTDAKYSVWEAEGTPIDIGDATLEHDPNKAEVIIDGSRTVLKLLPDSVNRTFEMINGPYYTQDVKYYTHQSTNEDTLVIYRADYEMKLEWNRLVADTNYSYNPFTPICRVQVTQSYPTSPVSLGCTYPIVDTLLTLTDFLQLRQWKKFSFNYTLENDSCAFAPRSSTPPPQYHPIKTTNAEVPGPRNSREYIQFKVIWLGNPNFLLSIDKVTITDQRGRDLLITQPVLSELQIKSQTDGLSSYNNSIAGWLGVDEPISIDIFEPIKRVTEILDIQSQQKRPLWLAWMGHWAGAWNQPENTFGAMGLSPWSEFKKRVGRANIIQDFYMYDYPYCDTCNPAPPNGEDWKTENIRIISELNYKQAYNLDPYFGASIQCGEVHNTQAFQRNVHRHEVLYNANLALMYGAKFIELWQYFAETSITECTSGSTCNGIVYFEDDGAPQYSDKYFMLRDTLSPRLKGLFGKTLKKLTPTYQYLDHQLSTPEGFIKSIIKGGCTAQGMQPGGEAYDLGFYKDVQDADYFMLISRWYNPGCNPSLTVKIKPDYFSNYNLRVVNYIDSQTTITNRFGSISTAPIVGDAGFFGVFPVLKYGGSIIANDTTYDNETLLSDLSIENGVTLTVNGTYNAKANITVKNGGKIVAGTNGKIIFDPYKNLTVTGITEIKGTSSANKLTLEFLYANNGIDIMPGSNFTLAYCNVSGSYNGIVTRTEAQSYVNISNSNIAAGSAGIILSGNLQGEGFNTPPTSTIYKCNFTTSSTGVSVSNYSAVLIKENTFTNCCISVLNVPSAFIQGNNISLGTNSNQSGIFVNNSGGYIRINTVKNRVYGIHIANSSPDCGGNILEDNYKHGLYIGRGSFPNLVGLIQTNPPTYYPLAGYNTIKNNGNDTRSGRENDGSEIYFSFSDARLGTEINPGCNQISDDRTSTPIMNTLKLLSGIYGNEPHFLDAIYNYWGTTTPTSSRFGVATNFFPYRNSPCLIIGSSEEEKIVLKTSSGLAVDTIYAAEGVPENFTTLEASYSEADNYFATGNVTQAKPLYEQIVIGNYTSAEKLPAYNKLYTIANLTGEEANYFSSLQTTFDDIANAETDTLIKKIYQQNAIKCDVSKEEYLTAISKFDNIIQQNPNSEEAVYAEIDILTTALNLDTTNSGLGKIAGGKYLVKGTSDYLTKLNDLLQAKFGINNDEKELIIPKEYSLYQNYPNPFNPITTIKFDLPKDGLVTLEIFDILGRRITTLVNEQRTAGSYEQVFNASSLASGVYVYKLQAGDFTASKKLILLK